MERGNECHSSTERVFSACILVAQCIFSGAREQSKKNENERRGAANGWTRTVVRTNCARANSNARGVYKSFIRVEIVSFLLIFIPRAFLIRPLACSLHSFNLLRGRMNPSKRRLHRGCNNLLQRAL